MPFIVVGVDSSPSSRAALREAVIQAKARDASILAVHVIVIPAMSGYEYGPIDLTEMKVAAQKMLDSEVALLRADFDGELPVEVKTKLATGHIGIELLRAAKEGEGAALVIAGSRGLGGFRSLLLGSVTTYLAHHLKCPLLIIPVMDDEDDD